MAETYTTGYAQAGYSNQAQGTTLTTTAGKPPRALEGHLENLRTLRSALHEAVLRADKYANNTVGAEPPKTDSTNPKPVSTPDSPIMWHVKECMDDLGSLMARLHEQLARIERL